MLYTVVQCLSTKQTSQAITVQGGNSLIVGVFKNGISGAPGAPGDTVNTYAQREVESTAQPGLSIYDCLSLAGSGPQVLTVSFTPGINTGTGLFLLEVNSLGLTFDTGATGNGNSGDPATTGLTLAGANELVIGIAAGLTAATGNINAGTGFAVPVNGQLAWGLTSTDSAALEYGTFSNSVTPAFSTALAVAWSMAAVAYKVVAPAGTAGTQLPTLGAG